MRVEYVWIPRHTEITVAAFIEAFVKDEVSNRLVEPQESQRQADNRQDETRFVFSRITDVPLLQRFLGRLKDEEGEIYCVVELRTKVLVEIILVTALIVSAMLSCGMAYKPPPGYSGIPIKYGGWIYGQATYQSAKYQIRTAVWATITVSNETYAQATYTNEFGYYRVYMPPGTYTLTVRYAGYSQSYSVTIKEDQIKYLLNIYIERPELGFRDHLEHRD